MKKTVLLFLSIFIANHAKAQLAPSSYVFTTTTPVKSTHAGKGWGSDAGFEASTTYSMRFGETSNGVDGVNRFITGFVAASFTYKPIDAVSTNPPFSKVVVNRVGNPNVGAGVARVSSFFENNSPATGDNTIYLKPAYVNTMEAYINSKICNRGSDNLFANADATTLNNVERVDMIMETGIATTNVSKTGFLTVERGGNDNCKIAAILSLDANGRVKTLGPLVNISSSNWSQSTVMIPSTVIMKDPADADLRPKQNLNSQAISGTFATCSALGIANGQTFYGVALFPGDVTAANDLIGLTNVPTDTDGTTNGGLDFMAGGGFFIEQNTTLASVISGTVYHDANGITDGIINGNPLGNPSATQLYAYLVKDGLVVSRTVVDASTGFYSLPGSFATAYSVVISSTNVAAGESAPTQANLPAGWVATGDNFGTGNTAGSGNESSAPDLKIAVTTPASGNVTLVNFGIEQLPKASTLTQTAEINPGGVISTVVLPATFGGTDEDGTVSGIRLTAFPSNATSIMIGTTTYYATAGNIPGTCPTATCLAFPVIGIPLTTNSSGQPTSVIKVDPTDGVVTVGIPYKTVDNAGKESLTAGSANIPFILPPVAVDDKGSSALVQPVTVNILANDKLGNGSQAVAASVDADLDPKTPGIQHSLVVAEQGTWSYVKETGLITFSPLPKLSINPTPIPYKLIETATGLSDDALVTITYEPLPVKLISFSVQLEGMSSVLLSWTTSEETRSDRFEIERSTNGKDWFTVGAQKSNGESAVVVNYSFTDPTPGKGINYYRLKMVDTDESFAYSRIQGIKVEAGVITAVYPNPAQSYISLPNPDGTVIKIYDTAGILKLTSKIEDGQVSIQKLPEGIYVLQTTTAFGETATERFVISK